MPLSIRLPDLGSDRIPSTRVSNDASRPEPHGHQEPRLETELHYLSEGWDSYNAPKPANAAINAASNFISLFPLFKPIQISPCADGGVTLLYSLGKNNILIDCYNSGEIISASWQEQSIPVTEEITLKVSKLTELSKWLLEGSTKCATA